MPRISPPGEPAGFSLFELIVVLIVLTVAAALVLPSLTRGMSGLEMDAAARDMLTLMKKARSEAIAEQKVFRVMLETDPNQPADAYVYTNEYEEEIKRFEFPRGIRILVKDPDSNGMISFFPNGRSSGFEFQLRNEQGKTLLVEVDPVTGFARLSKSEETP